MSFKVSVEFGTDCKPAEYGRCLNMLLQSWISR